MNLQKEYDFQFKTIENCGGAKQVIKMDTNSSLSLSEKCELFVNICGETIGFKTAKVC